MHALRLAAGGVVLAVVVTAAPAMGDSVGSPAGDSIRGGTSGELIEGRAGEDRIWGANGDDRLQGQRGRDRIWPGAGADVSHGGTGRDRIFLRVDRARDRVDCGAGVDLAMYRGPRDPADTLTRCERVWTEVTTPFCVTGSEWGQARVGMRMSWVHRIFESDGSFRTQHGPRRFSLSYRQCEPTDEECEADAEFEVGPEGGVPRLAGKYWGSMCFRVDVWP